MGPKTQSFRLPMVFASPLSTAYGAMCHAMYPHNTMDSRVCVPMGRVGVGGQNDSMHLFARYHLVARGFMNFQHVPFIGQITAACVYDVLGRILAITGLTLLFFQTERYKTSMYTSSTAGFRLGKLRWEWYSSEVQRGGLFPLTLAEMPTIPGAFSYEWLMSMYTSLFMRAVFA